MMERTTIKTAIDMLDQCEGDVLAESNAINVLEQCGNEIARLQAKLEEAEAKVRTIEAYKSQARVAYGCLEIYKAIYEKQQLKLAMVKAVLTDIESSAVAHPAFSGDSFNEVEYAGGDTAFVTHDIALRATNALAKLEE